MVDAMRTAVVGSGRRAPFQGSKGSSSLTAHSGVEMADVALVLAVDASGSISSEDVAFQFRGYAEAISSRLFMNALQRGRHGRIALTFVAWSGAERQRQLVPWMLIDSVMAADRFAKALLEAPPLIPGYTSISGAIDFARQLLSGSEFSSARRIIDVSGDGSNNDGRTVSAARDDAVACGITVNGLALIRREPDIADYYRRNVVGGRAAFVIVGADTESFCAAVLEKLVTEIS